MKQTRPSPTNLVDKVKALVWRGIYPYFATIRNALLSVHIINHEGRQRYLLGMLAPSRSVNDFLKYLETRDFGNHFVAWKDEGEVIGLRRLDGFERQYHLRIFADGEVRGHYEFTPESHPYAHWIERGEEDRTPEFLAFCGDWVMPAGNLEKSYPTQLLQHCAQDLDMDSGVSL